MTFYLNKIETVAKTVGVLLLPRGYLVNSLL